MLARIPFPCPIAFHAFVNVYETDLRACFFRAQKILDWASYVLANVYPHPYTLPLITGFSHTQLYYLAQLPAPNNWSGLMLKFFFSLVQELDAAISDRSALSRFGSIFFEMLNCVKFFRSDLLPDLGTILQSFSIQN